MATNDFDFTKHDPKKTYKSFVKQLVKWYDGGELPSNVGQDLRFVLELQKEKLKSLGLNMKCESKKTGSIDDDTAAIYYDDKIFTNMFYGGNTHMARCIGDTQKELYKTDGDIGFTTVIQYLKNDTQPDINMPLCCPNCGAPSTLGELEAGCKFCGTKFLMDQLYPKVINYFTYTKKDSVESSSRNKRDLALMTAIFSVPIFILSFMVRYLLQRLNLQAAPPPEYRIMSIASSVIGSVMGGGMLAIVVFIIKKLLETFGLMRKGLRGVGKTGSSLYYDAQIKKYDPEFTSVSFRDKAMSLFRMAVYSKDTSELACFRCKCPEKAADIIDAQFFNFGIDKCKIKDMVCDVDLTLYLDCIHYRNGKVFEKEDKYRMSMRKKIKSPTDLGFSFSAVSCPSCGASFDARNVKACPYCNNPYPHEEYDWIVTDIKPV